MVHRLGYSPADHAQSFYVVDVQGPLVDGELDRAEEWGEHLGARSAARAHGSA